MIVCPHCKSAAGLERDEWGYAYCQDCDRAVDDLLVPDRQLQGGADIKAG